MIKKAYLQFLSILLIIALLNAALIYIASLYYMDQEVINTAWFSLGFFTFLTGLLFYFNLQGAHSKKNANFMANVFGTMGIKMLFSIAFILLFYFFVKPQNKLFIVPFLFIYFEMLLLETAYLFKYLKSEEAGLNLDEPKAE